MNPLVWYDCNLVASRYYAKTLKPLLQPDEKCTEDPSNFHFKGTS